MPFALSFLHLPPNPAPIHSFTLHRTHHLSLRSDPRPRRAAAAAAEAENPPATVDVEMVRGRDGVWTAGSPTVVVLWDLDNKPPRRPPFPAATSLIAAASLLGRVVSVSAFANRHAFSHLPAWVSAERRDGRALDWVSAERTVVVAPPVPYSCAVCGRRFPTRPDLTRHFRQLHERERNKKLNRLRSLKGKKRQKFRERFISGNTKYEDAARELLTPKVGYGLACPRPHRLRQAAGRGPRAQAPCEAFRRLWRRLAGARLRRLRLHRYSAQGARCRPEDGGGWGRVPRTWQGCRHLVALGQRMGMLMRICCGAVHFWR